MNNQFIRTEILLGKDSLNKLSNAKVAIFGVGGVGSYTVEALARSGVGNFYLFDNDTVAYSNINRQLVATYSTVDMNKVDVATNRILDINPLAKVYPYKLFLSKENKDKLNYQDFDYIVDAIDTITSKIFLIEKAKEFNVPIISSMGAGNKLDPTKFEVADISKTSVCPLARVMRIELKKRHIKSVKVVFSKEKPITPSTISAEIEVTKKRQTPGSVSFVPSVAGLIIAGEVIKDLIKGEQIL